MAIHALSKICINALILTSLLCTSVSASKTLTVWIMPNGDYPTRDIKRYTDEFTRLSPNIEVKIEVLSWSNALSRLKMMAKTNQGPDIVQIGTTWTPYFAELGVLLDLTPFMSNFGNPEDFEQSIWKSTHRHGIDEVIALPWFLDVRAIALNKKYYTNLAFTPENFATYDKFKQSLNYFSSKKFTHKGGKVWPITFSGIGDWNLIHNFAPWVWSNGGSFVKLTDGKFTSNLTDPKTIKGIKEYISFYFDKLIDSTDIERGTTLTEKKFNDGKAFCLLGTSFGALSSHNQLVTQGKAKVDELEDMVLIPYPAGPEGRYTFVGGSNLSITKFSKNRSESLKLLRFLMADSNLYRYTRDIGSFSAKKSVLKSVPEYESDYYKTILKSLEIGRGFPNIPEWTDIGYALKEGLENIWWQVSGIYGEFNEDYFMKELKNIDYEINKLLERESVDDRLNNDEVVIEIDLSDGENDIRRSPQTTADTVIDSLGLSRNSINAIIGILLSVLIASLILFIAKNKRSN